MKKVIFTCIILLTTLFSCGNNTSNDSGDNGKVTIKVAGWNLGAKVLGVIAKEYEKDHPNVNVEIVEVDSGYKKITPALASNQGAPDAFTVQTRDIQALLDRFPNQFYNISKFVKKDGLEDKYVKTDMLLCQKDNNIYALPWNTGPVAVYYRKDMFKKAGIDPNQIETWDDYIAAGKKISKELPGVTMTGFEINSTNLFQMIYRELGGTYIKNGKLDINSPQAAKAYQLMVKMQKEGTIININDWNGKIVAFNNNKIASVIFPIWYAGTIQTTAKDQAGKWGLFPIPAFEKGGLRRSALGGSVFAVSSQTKHPKIAYDFIKYATSEMKSLEIITNYGLFSTYTPFYKTEEFKKYNPYFEMNLHSYFAKMNEGILPINYGSVMLEAGAVLNSTTASIMNGENIQEALSNASKSISTRCNLDVNQY